MYKLYIKEENQRSNCQYVPDHNKAREFQKNISLIDWSKTFVCIKTFVWKILKEMGIPDHFTWLLRNVYAGQEATVRT